jgi:hypothetical protein
MVFVFVVPTSILIINHWIAHSEGKQSSETLKNNILASTIRFFSSLKTGSVVLLLIVHDISNQEDPNIIRILCFK